MSVTDFERRRAADLVLMQALRDASSLFTFEAQGAAPDYYQVRFKGRGLVRELSSSVRVGHTEEHACEIRLTPTYPQTPPNLRWLTPIFHPNISFGGFVEPSDIGIRWDSNLGLDLVCERLWDVARGYFVDFDRSANPAAREWYLRQSELALPVDPRPIRNLAQIRGTNVFRYQRKAGDTVRMTGAAAETVFYIGEDTPLPAFPTGDRSPKRRSDDILYIGEENDFAE